MHALARLMPPDWALDRSRSRCSRDAVTMISDTPIALASCMIDSLTAVVPPHTSKNPSGKLDIDFSVIRGNCNTLKRASAAKLTTTSRQAAAKRGQFSGTLCSLDSGGQMIMFWCVP